MSAIDAALVNSQQVPLMTPIQRGDQEKEEEFAYQQMLIYLNPRE